MATGIPTSKKEIKKIELSYSDKIMEADILSTCDMPIRVMHKSESGNKLYFGNNYDVLHTLLQDNSICGNVKLIYIDPPFATRGLFLSRKQDHAYSDDVAGADYIEFLRKRLVLLRELLSEEGSIYLHLDENMIFEMKIIMDEVFGGANYKNLIIRKKCNPKNYTRKRYGNMVDYILFYTKTDKYTWNKPRKPLSQESLKEYRYVEPETGRKFMKVPIHAPGVRNGETGQSWHGMAPPLGKHWQYTPKKLDEMDKNGEIFWSKNGNPRRKVYLDSHPGVGVQDIWLDFKDAHNQNIKITGYPTEKNPELLKRIIEASSNEDDIVLDCFAGSGTTLAVANQLKRNWIGVDNSPEAIKTIINRFQNGLEPMGDYVNKETVPESTLFDDLESVVVDYSKNKRDHFGDFTLYASEDSLMKYDFSTVDFVNVGGGGGLKGNVACL